MTKGADPKVELSTLVSALFRFESTRNVVENWEKTRI